VAISLHITPPYYRSSCIIGAVFGEITLPTLPIIYHMEEKTAPIILLFGSVSCENQRLVVLVDLPPHNNCAVPISFAMRRPLSYCTVNSSK